MNKSISLTILIVFLFSCSKQVDYQSTLNRVTLNNTNKDIVQIIKTKQKIDTIISKGKDSINLSFVVLRTIEESVFSFGEYQNDAIIVENEETYCLTDTTMFEYSIEYSFRYEEDYLGDSDSEKVYGRQLSFELANKSTDSNPIVNVYLKITDSIIGIMQKDYTMLDKFKEYYSD